LVDMVRLTSGTNHNVPVAGRVCLLCLALQICCTAVKVTITDKVLCLGAFETARMGVDRAERWKSKRSESDRKSVSGGGRVLSCAGTGRSQSSTT